MDSSKALKTTSGRPGRCGEVCGFDQVPAGDYGIAVYHDENSNGKLDRNFVGIPKEAWAPAMMPPISSGPPLFDRAPASATEIQSLTTHIRYP